MLNKIIKKYNIFYATHLFKFTKEKIIKHLFEGLSYWSPKKDILFRPKQNLYQAIILSFGLSWFYNRPIGQLFCSFDPLSIFLHVNADSKPLSSVDPRYETQAVITIWKCLFKFDKRGQFLVNFSQHLNPFQKERKEM